MFGFFGLLDFGFWFFQDFLDNWFFFLDLDFVFDRYWIGLFTQK